MAPRKKSKSVNKVIEEGIDSPPAKDDKSNKQKKQKLSEMLGHQWSKIELRRFYNAYRKYDQDWKKVARAVRSRSSDMVEALYIMNRAYLSLPHGTASVAGLIAMMTDHYSVMEGSCSDKDSEEESSVCPKIQKHLKDTEETSFTPRKIHKQPKDTEDISFMPRKLQKYRKDAEATSVMLREIHPKDTVDTSVMPRKIQKHPKAKGLVEPIRKSSLQLQSVGSSDGCMSLLKLSDGMQTKFPVRKRTPRIPLPRGSLMNADDVELSHDALELTETRQSSNSLHRSQTVAEKFEHIKNSLLSYGEKQSQYTALKLKTGRFAVDEESLDGSLGSSEAKFGSIVRDSVESDKYALTNYKRANKGKKRVNISEAELPDDIQEAYEFPDRGTVVSESEGAKIQSLPSEGQRKRKVTTQDEPVNSDALWTLAETALMLPYLDMQPDENAGESVAGHGSVADSGPQFDGALKDQSTSLNKKRKCQASKTTTDEEVKSADSTISKRCKSAVKSPDVSSTNDQHMEETEVATPCYQIQAAQDNIIRKSKRKRDRTLLQNDGSHASSVFSREYSSLSQDRVHSSKGKLSHGLSGNDVRRWCVYEWFYSAIDYPWFAKREFVEYLNHVGLGHISRLTRVEWGVIRSSLGKPRRFSDHFLRKERDKLKQYRDSVRTHYANLRAGLGEGLHTDLACPLSVGQRVIAIHPRTREVHSGSVLIVEHNSCLIQFDHLELGAEKVMDIDCMPLNPVENMPESLKRRKMTLDYRYSQFPKVNGVAMLCSDDRMRNADSLPLSPSVSNDVKGKPECVSVKDMVTRNGSFVPSGATQSQFCNIAQRHPSNGDSRSAAGLMQLDTKVLGQHCVYTGNPPCWSQPVVNSGSVNGTIPSLNSSRLSCQEVTSNVTEIVEGSRERALKMVDVAVKAMSAMKGGEDTYGMIDEPLDAPAKAEHATNCQMSNNTVREVLPSQNPVKSRSPEPQLAGNSSSAKTAADVARDLQIPSDLIASCVAIFLTIQSCTERQYPPAEIAQILDHVVTSLRPRSSQNLSIYRDIVMCIGRIKTQILALVPT